MVGNNSTFKISLVLSSAPHPEKQMMMQIKIIISPNLIITGGVIRKSKSSLEDLHHCGQH